jgi:glycosyltransferase involved in cell wall biosynthesis
MKIGLIAHGVLPIPPKDWGAVENTIWHRKQHLERLGHTVDIANTRAIHDVIYYANQRRYDFVHCHNERFVAPCLAHLKCGAFAVTSHDGCLHHFNLDAPDRWGGFQYLFQDTLRSPANIVLSDRIRDLYLRSGYPHFLRVLRNAVETEAFRCGPGGNGRAVCVGLICQRKRQAWLAEVARHRVPVDFVGPWDRARETGLVEDETIRYLGVWDKPTLYERLTDYNCLVLLSDAEAAPKVVLEAFAAGLSVVITDACRANLTDEPFITVIPEGETRPDVIAQAIQTAIDANPPQRAAIRAYARDRFDYTVVTREYLQIIEEYLDARPSPDDRHSRTVY